MSQYTPKEISTIADKFKELVAERKIGFQLDAFGNPDAVYSKETSDQLVNAITSLDNFPRKEVVENAMLDAALQYHSEIFAAYQKRFSTTGMQSRVAAAVNRAIYEAALLEIPEHLFTTKQIQAMLRQHPDYLKVRDADIKAGKLYADEMEDTAKPETGIQSLSDFAQAFGRVA